MNLYSVSEVAKILRVSKNRIYKSIKSGEIPVIEYGSMKISEEALKEFIGRRTKNEKRI